MSADNGYIIRKHPKGGYSPVHYFASDEYYRKVLPSDVSYPTIQKAFAAVRGESTEYGTTLHSEVIDE